MLPVLAPSLLYISFCMTKCNEWVFTMKENDEEMTIILFDEGRVDNLSRLVQFMEG